jgi:hypothetical protein
MPTFSSSTASRAASRAASGTRYSYEGVISQKAKKNIRYFLGKGGNKNKKYLKIL